MSRKNTIKVRQNKVKEAFLEQLKRTPTIETACQKVVVSRMTVYRWIKAGKRFEKKVDEALAEGRAFMSDVAENQLFSLIGDKEMSAIRLYLSTHNPRYSNKLELKGTMTHEHKELTKEQKTIIRKALKLAGLNKKPYEQKIKPAPSAHRADAKGQTSQN